MNHNTPFGAVQLPFSGMLSSYIEQQISMCYTLSTAETDIRVHGLIMNGEKVMRESHIGEQNRNNYIDMLKCIACFGVIMLHAPTKFFSDNFSYIEVALGRCGVPIFFMLSGYLMGMRSIQQNSRSFDRKMFLRQAIKMIKYYIFFELLVSGLCFGLDKLKGGETVLMQMPDTGSILKLLIFNVPLNNGILWYILAYAYCLLVYSLMSFFKNGYRIIAWLSPLLLLGYFILGRYSVIAMGHKLDSYIASNFLFAAIPMFTIGFLLPNMNWKWLTPENNRILIAVCVLLMAAESLAFYNTNSVNTRSNNLMFNIIVAFLLVYYVVHIHGDGKRENIFSVIGYRYSLYIYVFQGVAAKMWMTLISFGGKGAVTNLVSCFYKISKPLTVFMTSLIISCIYCGIKNMIIKLKISPKKISQ